MSYLEQTEDEYELERGELSYMLTVTWEWIRYPHDWEGIPECKPGDPLIEVKRVEVLNVYKGEQCQVDYDFGPYPELEPGFSEEERRDFEEAMCDRSGPDV